MRSSASRKRAVVQRLDDYRLLFIKGHIHLHRVVLAEGFADVAAGFRLIENDLDESVSQLADLINMLIDDFGRERDAGYEDEE